jgi:adenylate cyclase
MGTRRKRQLLAIMFTDMEGYSERCAQDEDAALGLLEEHDRLLVPIVDQRGGTIVKRVGDAIVATFSAASDALDAAVEMQAALRRRNRRAPSCDPIDVRIGVHVGDVAVDGEDIMGVATNLTKRLESRAAVGKVYCTEAVRLMIPGRPRYRFARVQADWKPKGSPEPMAIYTVTVSMAA